MSPRIRVLAWIEALSLTGPAKNLLAFAAAGLSLNPCIELSVATFRRPGDASTDGFLEAATRAGVNCHVVRERHPGDWNTVTAMRELTRRLEPDLVQTHNNKSHLLLRCSGLWRNMPWLAFHHGYTQTSGRQRLYNLTDFWSLRAARFVVTVTAAFLPELKARGVPKERVKVVPNGIDARGVPLAGRSLTASAKPVILSVGRLSLEKGHVDLVRALKMLNRPCRLVLVGEGPEQSHLSDAAKNSLIELEFTGLIPDPGPLYRQADLFVLPSHSEGSPNVLLEAMAAGVPVVATSVGGVPEIVEHERHALLSAPADPLALSTAIQRLLDKPELGMDLSARARERVAREFSMDARNERLRGIYEEVWRLSQCSSATRNHSC